MQIYRAIVRLCLHSAFIQKNSQATTKCDAERNWSTYGFNCSKIEEKTGQQR